jgi:hypothetical protein
MGASAALGTALASALWNGSGIRDGHLRVVRVAGAAASAVTVGLGAVGLQRPMIPVDAHSGAGVSVAMRF